MLSTPCILYCNKYLIYYLINICACYFLYFTLKSFEFTVSHLYIFLKSVSFSSAYNCCVQCYAVYDIDSSRISISIRLASGARQPSGTPLKNIFKLLRNSRNWSTRYT